MVCGQATWKPLYCRCQCRSPVDGLQTWVNWLARTLPEQTYTALTSASGSITSPPTYTKLPDTSPFTLVWLLRQKDEAKVYCAIVELYGALKGRLGTHCANKRAQYFHATRRCVLEVCLRQKDEAKVYCAIVELYGALKGRLGTHCANKRAQYFHVTRRCVLEVCPGGVSWRCVLEVCPRRPIKGKDLFYPTVKIKNTAVAAGDRNSP